MWKSKPRSLTTYRRPFVTIERLIAIVAVATTAAGFAQPQVLALAGLDFQKPGTAISRNIDHTATGSIAARPAEANRPDATIHGLAGTLKALRARD